MPPLWLAGAERLYLTDTTFVSLGIAEPLLRCLTALKYETPTPIQVQAIPQLLAGKDMLGIAQTGTGKTAAFGLPILQHLTQVVPGQHQRRLPRALILSPTRELAMQIGQALRSFARGMPVRTVVVVGGLGIRPQIQELQRGCDIVVATPGRLLDLVNQRAVQFTQISHFTLDEADRMLDLGFINDVRKIAGMLPKVRQTLLFSATMPSAVEDLARQLLKDPVRVEVTPLAPTVDRIEQHVVMVEATKKRAALNDLLQSADFAKVIVFTRTKHRANGVAEQLVKAGVRAEAIHGDKSQGQRQRALDSFRNGHARVLVATDLAARGIDVPGVSHVINYELPNEPESYVHRIGRTARAGASGIAISLCDGAERSLLRSIERLTRRPIAVMGTASAPIGSAPAYVPSSDDQVQRRGQRPHRNNNGNPQQRQGRHHRNGGAPNGHQARADGNGDATVHAHKRRSDGAKPSHTGSRQADFGGHKPEFLNRAAPTRKHGPSTELPARTVGT